MDEITASNETLYKQAFMTAQEYLSAAISSIDEEFGDGYAKQHPELVGKYMEVIALDLHTGILGRELEKIAENILNGTFEVSESLEEVALAINGIKWAIKKSK